MDFSLILCGEKNFYRTAIFLYGPAGRRESRARQQFLVVSARSPEDKKKGSVPPFTLIAFLPSCPRLKGKLRLFFNANIPRFP